MRKILFNILMTVSISAITAYFVFNYNGRALTFVIPENYKETPEIKIENEKVFQFDNYINSVTLTTKRPISVSVKGKTQYIKINKLSKNNIIPINIIFNNKKIQYYLQTLPEPFPNIFTNNKTQQKGYVLTSFFNDYLDNHEYCAIIDMYGNVVYYRTNATEKWGVFHLKKVILPNGKTRYIQFIQDEPSLNGKNILGYYLITDENFREKARVKMLKTEKHDETAIDEHDFLVLDDGHYIMFGINIRRENIQKGKTRPVIHTVIQEQKDGKVLFDWNSRDYNFFYDICVERCPQEIKNVDNLNDDYIHINSLAIDPSDGNLLASSASGYFIMKINRKTGKVMWILGGKGNQFDIPEGGDFIRQHDIQISDDGQYTLLDNHKTMLSLYGETENDISSPGRILTFKLDENNKKMFLDNVYDLNFEIPWTGSAQKLKNGGWFIGCGGNKDCVAIMYNNNFEPVWSMNTLGQFYTYKAYYEEKL